MMFMLMVMMMMGLRCCDCFNFNAFTSAVLTLLG